MANEKPFATLVFEANPKYYNLYKEESTLKDYFSLHVSSAKIKINQPY